MALDNPFEQVEALIGTDDRQSLPPSVEAILKLIEKLPGNVHELRQLPVPKEGM
jgi:hypothetical protein